jgi:hypothetical protein
VAVTPEGGAQVGPLALGEGRLRLELGQVLLDAAVEGQGDDLARRGADAGQVREGALGVAAGDLLVAQLADEGGRLAIGSDAPALGQHAVEEVDDAVEGLGGGHRHAGHGSDGR